MSTTEKSTSKFARPYPRSIIGGALFPWGIPLVPQSPQLVYQGDILSFRVLELPQIILRDGIYGAPNVIQDLLDNEAGNFQLNH